MSYSRNRNDRSAFNKLYGQLLPGGSHEQSFRCLSCRIEVSCDTRVAGVRNRNHCPYCLWSRHMDLQRAGDRLATCRAGMRPLGLTAKRQVDKYGIASAGELMLIHICVACDKLSINRIAADDHPLSLREVFEESLALDAELLALLEPSAIDILGQADLELLQTRVYGRGLTAMLVE